MSIGIWPRAGPARTNFVPPGAVPGAAPGIGPRTSRVLSKNLATKPNNEFARTKMTTSTGVYVRARSRTFGFAKASENRRAFVNYVKHLLFLIMRPQGGLRDLLPRVPQVPGMARNGNGNAARPTSPGRCPGGPGNASWSLRPQARSRTCGLVVTSPGVYV